MTRVDAEILTVDDLAELFACDKETAAARLTSGDLPGVKVGRGWIIPRQALFERLNEKAKEEAAARRSTQTHRFAEASQRGAAAQIAPKHLDVVSPFTPITTSTSKQRGRKRRTPPELPPLP